MCGYCTETFALMACLPHHPDSPSEAESTFLDVHLQEVRNLPDALTQLTTRSVTKPHIAFIILCRALETLVESGFRSAIYQELLQHPMFSVAILTACSAFQELAADSVETRLKPNEFAWIFEKDIYLVLGSFEQYSDKVSEQTCINLLNEYIAWWLEDGNVPHQDLNQRMEDFGIMDPIEDIPASERSLLEIRFPALLYSLTKASVTPDGKSVLWTIVTKSPSGVPFFDGLDLWLQRRATQLIFDRHGLAPFLICLKETNCPIRVELFEILAASKPLSAEDKTLLLAALEGWVNKNDTPASEWYWAET